ncbi:MAG: 9-O-acetylesterase [Bacteroidales bacterium 45-6]|nr:MAG: 9-O-acetylesterase [Bacteroidales bacterium 45-6]
MNILKSIFLAGGLLLAGLVQASVKLPSIFSDNMVLQQNKVIQVWGWADKGETVEVSFQNQTRKVKADKSGNWAVTFAPQAHGGPYTLDVKGKSNRLSLHDILIGEVWLCSGQSNMEFAVKNANNASVEISRANNPQIRSFNVTKAMGSQPKNDLEGRWQVCSPATVADFSAVGYFFALNLYTELGVPVGIINSSWGGTDIETWISDTSFNELPGQFSKRYEGKRIDNVDQFQQDNKSRKEDYLKAMDHDPGISGKWFSSAETDVAAWPTMQVPQLWEGLLGDVDGIVWYSFLFDLPKEDAGKAAAIQLGPIDDNDITWVNGQTVGHTEGYTMNRQYNIPEKVLVAGKNQITVKVTDFSGGGGFYGKADGMYLVVNGKRYSLAANWHYKPAVTNKQFNYVELSPNVQPSLLFNAMINPLTKFQIAGAIWYQGENNAGQAYNYKTLFPALINDWRKQWHTEFPFYWVQLANFQAKDADPVESNWAELRQAQTLTLSLPKTGQAVITDIGEANDIHPRNKQDVGRRLALIALRKTYGKTDLVYSGPTFRSMEIKGSKVVLSFDNIGGGLVATSKYGYVEGFTISGKDKKFVWAKAYIDGDKVVVYSDSVVEPVAVRFAWANNPDVNLFNKEGLPAVPFQTDGWKWSTQY